MIKNYFILGIIFLTLCFGCKKNTGEDEPFLPAGVTAYTDEEVAFVSYSSGNFTFKKAPDFIEEFNLNFKERIPTKEFHAWDQTFFIFSTDIAREVELRLRYLQIENTSQKTLAIYMPYRDETSAVRSTLFEIPIDTTGITTNFFSEIITFHSTLEINGANYENVYEISPLTAVDEVIDGPLNYTKIYYNSTVGIIEMDLKNGDKWILFP